MPATLPQKKASAELLRLYEEVRAYTTALCQPLETEDYVPQPVVDVSPPKWNIAHTTWFFEEMVLKQFVAGYREFDPVYGYFFNSYYNSIGERTLRHNRGDLSRPTVREIFAYRRHVDEKMRELLAGSCPKEAYEIIVLGINHEQQHQELFLTDLKYILACNPLYPVYRDDFAIEETAPPRTGELVELEAGLYQIGFAGEGFCFDNELGRHTVFLDEFSLGKDLVTNAEFLEFIEDGGYRNDHLWHSEGWDWVNQNQIFAPLYWQRRNEQWFSFTLAGLRKIVPEAPVCHISFYEAAAFAEWSGARLPTEFEWEAASPRLPWGLRWEWTGSAYLPYPNFRKPAGAIGEYNGKFMVNQMVLRGASIATPEGHSRPTYRNFFHPHLRWQFTGLRLAR